MISNIYQEARRQAKLTQHEAAEALFVGHRTVQHWESGKIMPSAEMVEHMARLYNSPWLGYRHLQETSRLGRTVLPEVKPMELCQAVVCMQNGIANVQNKVGNLLAIAADGIVDTAEMDTFDVICKEAEGAAGALLTLALCGRKIQGGSYARY